MKLIIDIPEVMYEGVKLHRVLDTTVDCILEAVENGTPLDEIKAEIEKQIERDFAFAETETLKVPCHYGTANGLQVAIRIIDGYKRERGVKNDILC